MDCKTLVDIIDSTRSKLVITNIDVFDRYVNNMKNKWITNKTKIKNEEQLAKYYFKHLKMVLKIRANCLLYFELDDFKRMGLHDDIALEIYGGQSSIYKPYPTFPGTYFLFDHQLIAIMLKYGMTFY